MPQQSLLLRNEYEWKINYDWHKQKTNMKKQQKTVSHIAPSQSAITRVWLTNTYFTWQWEHLKQIFQSSLLLIRNFIWTTFVATYFLRFRSILVHKVQYSNHWVQYGKYRALLSQSACDIFSWERNFVGFPKVHSHSTGNYNKVQPNKT